MPSKKKPSRGSVPGTRYLAVSEARFKDMKALLSKERWDGAVYIGGYVIECFLKYRITVGMGVPKLPANYEIHTLDILAGAAFATKDWDTFTRSNKAIESIMEDWSTSLRYQVNITSAAQAKVFCNLVDLVYDQLKELTP